MAASFDNIVATWLVVAALLLLNVAAYRFFFSPISDVPGPFGASVTRLWHVFHIFKGDNNLQAIALHEKHGHFVRIAPDEVSVSHPDGPRLILQAPLRKASHAAFSILVPMMTGKSRLDGTACSRYLIIASSLQCLLWIPRRK
jgi:hypothetical protein